MLAAQHLLAPGIGKEAAVIERKNSWLYNNCWQLVDRKQLLPRGKWLAAQQLLAAVKGKEAVVRRKNSWLHSTCWQLL